MYFDDNHKMVVAKMKDVARVFIVFELAKFRSKLYSYVGEVSDKKATGVKRGVMKGIMKHRDCFDTILWSISVNRGKAWKVFVVSLMK